MVNNTPRKPVVVIGLGNSLLADEGIGVRVVEDLSRRAAEFPGVEFLAAGTAGMAVVHAMAGRRKAVLVDCARMDEKPGTCRRFLPDDAASRKQLSGLSLHEGDLMAMIDLSRRLGEAPPDIVVFGIQPADVSMSEQLSPILEAGLAEYEQAVSRELGG